MLQETIITQAVVEASSLNSQIILKMMSLLSEADRLVLCLVIISRKRELKRQFMKETFSRRRYMGGGMLMNQVVLQDDCMHIAEEFSFRLKKFREGYYTVDAVEMSSKLIAQTLDAGCVYLIRLRLRTLLL